MNIIITMAGLGERFKRAGYTLPKYMIIVNGDTLFEWSMKSLIGFNNTLSKYIFIVRKEDNAQNFISEKCKKIGIKNFCIKEIDFITDGQASTALLAKDLCAKNESILIYNIDTFVIPNVLKSTDIKGEGFIPCALMEGNHWSFVKTDINYRAIEVAEKKRISNNCSIGLYYFSSYSLFENLYKEFYLDKVNVKIKERYIAPIYNLLIQNKKEVYISIIEKSKVFVLGTPEEVKVFQNNWQG